MRIKAQIKATFLWLGSRCTEHILKEYLVQTMASISFGKFQHFDRTVIPQNTSLDRYYVVF